MIIQKNTLFLGVFLAMSVVYGAFSSSSPDKIGVAELFIGLCLLVFVGVRRPIHIFDLRKNDNNANGVSVPLYVRIGFLYLLFIPTFHGLIVMQNDFGNWVRDIIPLMYMFLPILLLSLVRKEPEKWLIVLVVSLCTVGFLFSWRVVLDPSFIVNSSGMFSVNHEESNQDHLMQDVSVNFGLTFLMCMALWYVLKREYLKGVTLFLVAFVFLLVVVASVLRAPLGLLLVVLISLIFSQVKKKKVLLTLVVMVLLIAPFILMYIQEITLFINQVLSAMFLKQEIYGINSRDLEVMAVINNAGKNITLLLFGEGWGGLLSNPIGGGSSWRFVHNMFMYFVFKVGIVGSVAFAFYFFWLFKLYICSFRSSSLVLLLSLSLISPLLIAMILEASYKSLSFGLVLLLIPLMSMVKDNPKIKGWL